MASIISRSPAETFAVGETQAAALQPHTVLALCGELGAGKTQFVQGLARGLGCPASPTSPTFTLIHEYGGGRLPLFHFDLYRLETAEQALAIGIEEYFESAGVSVVEWAGKFPELLPERTRWIRFFIRAGDEREIVFE